MAAITLDYTGTELTQIRAENPSPLDPIEAGARLRAKKFSYTAVGGEASGSQIELLNFENRVTIIGGVLSSISLSNSATLSLGWTLTSSLVDTNAAVFLSAVTAAAVFLPYTTTTTGATTFFGTTGVGALVAADVIEGYVLYVENS